MNNCNAINSEVIQTLAIMRRKSDGDGCLLLPEEAYYDHDNNKPIALNDKEISNEDKMFKLDHNTLPKGRNLRLSCATLEFALLVTSLGIAVIVLCFADTSHVWFQRIKGYYGSSSTSSNQLVLPLSSFTTISKTKPTRHRRLTQASVIRKNVEIFNVDLEDGFWRALTCYSYLYNSIQENIDSSSMPQTEAAYDNSNNIINAPSKPSKALSMSSSPINLASSKSSSTNSSTTTNNKNITSSNGPAMIPSPSVKVLVSPSSIKKDIRENTTSTINKPSVTPSPSALAESTSSQTSSGNNSGATINSTNMPFVTPSPSALAESTSSQTSSGNNSGATITSTNMPSVSPSPSALAESTSSQTSSGSDSGATITSTNMSSVSPSPKVQVLVSPSSIKKDIRENITSTNMPSPSALAESTPSQASSGNNSGATITTSSSSSSPSKNKAIIHSPAVATEQGVQLSTNTTTPSINTNMTNSENSNTAADNAVSKSETTVVSLGPEGGNKSAASSRKTWVIAFSSFGAGMVFAVGLIIYSLYQHQSPVDSSSNPDE